MTKRQDINQLTNSGPAASLGILLSITEETVTSDIRQMISKGQNHSLEGYIFCLSRIINHNFAWNCICKAFTAENAPISRAYYRLFGQELQQPNIKNLFTVK